MGPEGYARIQDAMDKAAIAVRTFPTEHDGFHSNSLPVPRGNQDIFNVEFVTIIPLGDETPVFVLNALSKANCLSSAANRGTPGTTEALSLELIPGAPDSLTFRDLNYPLSK